jgi:hypothetical protein
VITLVAGRRTGTVADGSGRTLLTLTNITDPIRVRVFLAGVVIIWTVVAEIAETV